MAMEQWLGSITSPGLVPAPRLSWPDAQDSSVTISASVTATADLGLGLRSGNRCTCQRRYKKLDHAQGN